MTIPNFPPVVSNIDLPSEVFPTLSRTSQQDLVAPRAADRQEKALEKRDITIVRYLNLIIAEVNSLSTTLTSIFWRIDGSNSPTADMTMNSHKFLNMTAGSATGHSANWDQLNALDVSATYTNGTKAFTADIHGISTTAGSTGTTLVTKDFVLSQTLKFITTTTGAVTISLGTGNWASIVGIASGGGSSNVHHGGQGSSATFRISHPTGGTIVITVGAGGVYGGGGGTAGVATTFIVYNSSVVEVARLTLEGGRTGDDAGFSTVTATGTLTYFDEVVFVNGTTGTSIVDATALATYPLTGQYVYGIGGRASTAPGSGITGRVVVII